MTRNQIIGAILGPILGLVIALISPPEGLTVEAMHALGIITFAVILLIFNTTHEYIVILFMCTFWALFKVVPFKTAFATFSQEAWWLLIGALGIGVGVSKSGLLGRLSLYVMKIFPATYKGQVMALISSGIVISPLIPSITAKAAIIAPISQGISDAMGYKRKSSGAAGLFGAFFIGFCCIAPMFLSASFLNYMLLGLLPTYVQQEFAWVTWFEASVVWGIVVLIICTVCLLKFYKPTENQKLPADYVDDKIKQLGPWTKKEKITGIVVVVSLIFWMTEALHGISASIISLLALAALLLCKVYERTDFRSGLGWDNVIFIGGIMNMGGVLSVLRIDKWIGGILEPYIVPFMSNLYIFIPALVITIYLVRFVIVSWAATMTIFILLLLPFAESMAINPWVLAFVVYTSINIWVVFYQNSVFLTSFYATGGEMVEHKQMIKLSLVYMFASLVALVVSIPVWQLMHLLP